MIAGHAVPTTSELSTLAGIITAARIEDQVARYTGAQPFAENGPVLSSRNIVHPGNRLAVDALAGEFTSVGGGRPQVRLHEFVDRQRALANVEAVLPGSGLDGVVILSAHLDSTARNSPDYRAATDPAPGADDDASGMAGVVSAADAMVALIRSSSQRRREIRFVLFNAEELGFVGSLHYARDRCQTPPVVAVFHMDMIGYNGNPGQVFELHAGCSWSAETHERSQRLALLIQRSAAVLAPELTAQIYPGVERRDPGECRSDHFRFLKRGLPACLISEDLFHGPGPCHPSAPNPHYHLGSDTTVHAPYAAGIARAVTAAAWIAATRGV